MSDQSKWKHVSNTQQKYQTRRDALNLSSDSLSDETTKIKANDDFGISTKSDSKPSGICCTQLKAFRGGGGKHMEVGRKAIPSEKALVPERDSEYTRQVCNTYMVEGSEQGASYLINKDAKGGKYSENREQVIAINATSLEINRPGKPVVKCISWDSVDIEWDSVANFCSGDVYQVRCENTRSRKWNCQNFEINSGKITSLQPGTSYSFKIRLVKSDGEECKYGETSKEVTTKKEPIPGKPLVQRVFADRVELIWERVDTFCRGDVYEVQIENINSKENICQTFGINSADIEDLQPDSPYVFKVRLVMQNGQVSKYSENSERVQTCSTFASKLVGTRCQVDTSDKGTALYELPLDKVKHARNSDARPIKYQIGPTVRENIVEKTIMLLGETGSGKSTFVDSLANYVLGVRLEDPYRFTVTREKDREKQKDKAISQTDWITCYSFNPQEGTRLTYRLNVVDTPGFNDTQGPKRDAEIVDQIHKLFTTHGERGVQVIDAVCVFVKAPDCRLTEAQSYIFNSVQSLFGKDIIGNICILITYADGSDPAVMDAVRKSGLPYGEKFSFNNFSWSSDPKANTASMFWKMSLKSFTALFHYLERLETKSLQLTKEVLKERHQLEENCQNLQTQIDARISIMNSIKKAMNMLQEHVGEIDKNKNFSYPIQDIKVISIDLPKNELATNCLICRTTCHDKCWTVVESFTRLCWAFSWISGNCTQCSRHCHWRSHETTGHRLKTCLETVTKTNDDMKNKFEEATEKFLDVNKELGKLRGQLEAIFSKLNAMLKSMVESKNRLNKIALRPDQLSIQKLIEQLIKAETIEEKPGFQDRIEQLSKFLEGAFLLEGSKNIESRSDT